MRLTIFIHLVCLWVLSTCSFWSYAQEHYPQLSEQSQISLITGTAGQPLYAAFGHSAVRVYDPLMGMDLVYNYGVFDFDTPNFYLKFASGRLPYQLEASRGYAGLMYLYAEEGRGLSEQVLNLSQAQKQAIFEALETNRLPENKYYPYDFFFDNCSTRVRDLFQKTLGADLGWSYEGFPEKQTFRDLIHPYLAHRPWIDLGINLLLGLPTDRVAKPAEYLFLPEYLQQAFDQATIRIDGKTQPFVARTTSLLEAPPEATVPTGLTGPWILGILILVFAATMTWLDYRRRRLSYWTDSLLLGTVGLIGCFFVLLWVGTDHQALPQNWNLTWAVPLHTLWMIVVLGNKKLPDYARFYALLATIWYALVLFTWPLHPQPLHPSLIPIMLALALRCWAVYRWAK